MEKDLKAKIEELKGDLSYEKLAVSIGVSASGLRKSLKNESIPVKTLEALARYFGVPTTYFIGENGYILQEPKPKYGGSDKKKHCS